MERSEYDQKSSKLFIESTRFWPKAFTIIIIGKRTLGVNKAIITAFGNSFKKEKSISIFIGNQSGLSVNISVIFAAFSIVLLLLLSSIKFRLFIASTIELLSTGSFNKSQP